MKKIRKTILGTILTVSLLSASVPVLACEQDTASNNDIVQITDSDEITEAAEMFQLTDEEAKNVTFYSANVEVLNHGVTTMPTFTMWTYNRGADRIFNGTKVATSVVIKGGKYTNLHLRFCSYQDVIWYDDVEVGEDGKGVYRGEWYNILYGGTYFMTYERLGGDGALQVTVVYAVY